MRRPRPKAATVAEPIRLQKVLAAAGVASRRRCEELMVAGRVEVNGEVVTQLGARVDPTSDIVRVDGKRIPPPSDHAYVLLNKPRGIVSSMADEQGRPDLTGLLGDRDDRLFHVGRLDTDTSGLLLLTNDGDLAHRLAHPSFEVTKTYVALVDGTVANSIGRTLRAGVELEDGVTVVDRFVVRDRSRGKSLVELDLHSGKNRIVRRLLDAVGHPVIELTRTAFGPLRLGDLRSGAMRDLSREELGALFDSVEA
ncbi:pseudouridine synthase [Aeromicrobium sp. 636]|uniref:Pseudouridine synthase n=1 Tax=Aeromicrobium senzhongii TaxID=2663859 RepID=A0A8I0ESF7_9ACTN|nr:rRNA pseudouridine synthase [Aeromicrobium senzhongii]MCQ3996817.1 pseudouridine synthase [Aeromicrobium sp. 636]MTB86749.1 pseudouridine synthase [Aeromicrobium senzhongii]QNL93402.1 rRNA pseudouridine synthase [Aeromicrobium senzhongii]